MGVFESLNPMLENIDPRIFVVVTVIGLLLALVFAIGWLRQRAKRRHLEADRGHLLAIAEKGREILAAAPDGLFLWDHIIGGVVVSRRLAVLLGLSAGTGARYDDIRGCFKGESLKALERGCSALRNTGTPFDLVLIQGDRLIQAIGQRAETDAGDVQADLVWMRDVTDLTSEKSREFDADDDAAAKKFDDRHLTALLDAMPVPMWLRDSELNLAFANRAAEGLVESGTDLAEQARSLGQPVRERRLLDRAGNAQLMELTEIPLGLQADGETSAINGSLGYALDRSEHKETESALLQHRQARDAVLEGLPSAVAVFGADRHLEFANAAYAHLWGLDQEWLQEKPNLSEILEKQREDRRLPEVPDFRAFKVEQIARFGALSTAQTEMLYLPTGRALRQRIQPSEDGGLVYAFEDISESLDLQRSYKALGAVQTETLDNLHEGVAVFGSDGRLQLYNPRYSALWQLDEAVLQAKPHLSEVLDRTRTLTPPPASGDVWADADWDNYKATETARFLSRTPGTDKLELTNGTVLTSALVPLPDGAILLSYVDVTDSTRVEGALRDRALAMEQADKMKSEFIADVAREVRTPLNTVIGFADMLTHDYFGSLNPRQSEYAKSISQTSRNLMSVVGDVLDLASMDAGQMELKIGSVDIHGLLVSAFNLIEDRAKRRNLNLEFDCPPDIGWISGDGERLKQVIYNLLANAATYTPPRGRISVSAAREADGVVIRVSDTGVGIPGPDKERIFSPFDKGAGASPANDTDKSHQQTDNGERGVGLGLTIAKRFIEGHGGSINVKSLVGRGTTVEITLPNALAEADD